MQTNFNDFPSISAQSKDKEKEEFECPANAGNGNFADPVTCRRFYQVSKFSAIVLPCKT